MQVRVAIAKADGEVLQQFVVSNPVEFYRKDVGELAADVRQQIEASTVLEVTGQAAVPARVPNREDFEEWAKNRGWSVSRGSKGYRDERTQGAWAMRCEIAHGDPAPSGQHPDAALLDFVREESLDLRSFSMPTGAGDADVGWKVIQHHMAKPNEREVGVAYRDDPREALREAMKGLGYKPPEALSAGAEVPDRQALALPGNEELERLWETTHYGHPADFGADVLQRWGGWPAGMLGHGGALQEARKILAERVANMPGAELRAEITQNQCCIGLSVEQFLELEKLDSLDVVFPALENAGAEKGSIEYSGHFGPNVFFDIDSDKDPQKVAAALSALIADPQPTTKRAKKGFTP